MTCGCRDSDPPPALKRISRKTKDINKPMAYLAAYLTALVVFGGIDALWLSFMGSAVYRPVLADILAPNLRLAPAFVFYAAFPIGLVVFGVLPGMRSGALMSAFAFAVLFGALAYATYDLTNYATLRVWTLQITLLDIGYGALASGVAATLACLAARTLTR
jgi:uncharacterized membrane protein